VQAVSCIAATPYHVLSGSDDSNVHVWSLPRLLELNSTAEHEPEGSLTNHRAAITDLVVGPSTNPDTNLCVSASKDKTCIIWNYQSGQALRTLLLTSAPQCLALDPSTRAVCISLEDGSVFVAEFLGERALLGPQTKDAVSTAIQLSEPLGVAPADAGPAMWLGLSYDGTTLLSGHPKGKIIQWNLSDNSLPVELANLNAAVTNLKFVPPLPAANAPVAKFQTVVKPSQADRNYTVTAQFDSDLGTPTRFSQMLNTPGFSSRMLENAIVSFQQPSSNGVADQELQRQNDELLEIINEQRSLLKATLQNYGEAKKGRT